MSDQLLGQRRGELFSKLVRQPFSEQSAAQQEHTPTLVVEEVRGLQARCCDMTNKRT